MLILQKYGGSSVANLDRIRACADRCLALAREGHRLVVVVSAMAGETNRLIALANELVAPGERSNETRGPYVHAAKAGAQHDRELDQLVATGEKVSAALLAMAINDRGGQAISLVGHQLGMQTDRAFTRARIARIDTERLRREVGSVVLMPENDAYQPLRLPPHSVRIQGRLRSLLRSY